MSWQECVHVLRTIPSQVSTYLVVACPWGGEVQVGRLHLPAPVTIKRVSTITMHAEDFETSCAYPYAHS